jgi:hypothetical protein
MLSIETRDGWTTAEMTVTVPAFPPETYQHSGQASAYHLAQDFAEWAEDPARGWFPNLLVTWTWARASNGGALITFTASGPASITWAPNAAWTALTYQTGATSATLAGTDGAVGTSCPFRGQTATGAQGPGFWSVRRAYRFSGDDGDASATGAIRPLVPGLAGVSPMVEAVGQPRDAARLRDVQQAVSNPRRFQVYDLTQQTWREFAFARATIETVAPLVFRLKVEAAGEAL